MPLIVQCRKPTTYLIVGDKSILRLISAKKKLGAFEKKFVRQGRKASDSSQYQFTVAYTGFDVDFYKKGEQNWMNRTGFVGESIF
ncbi:hypothetical protein Asch01_03287 [Acinetobacter schindleri]